MDLRTPDPDLFWAQPARPGVIATPMMPSMHDLATIARNIAAATSLYTGVNQLQRDICRLLRLTDAVCVWIDWPRQSAKTVGGPLVEHVRDLLLEVAAQGRATVVNQTLFQPIGPAPARGVLAMRKPEGAPFAHVERTILATLAGGIAPHFDRIVRLG